VTGFRKFCAQPAPRDAELLVLLAAARLRVEEAWEEEFIASMTRVIENRWTPSARQRDCLEKMAAGYYAEQRAQVTDDYEDHRDRNLRALGSAAHHAQED